jgi:hypothetical protein
MMPVVLAVSVAEAELPAAAVMCVQDIMLLCIVRILELMGLQVEKPVMFSEIDKNEGANNFVDSRGAPAGGRLRHIQEKNIFPRDSKEEGLPACGKLVACI